MKKFLRHKTSIIYGFTNTFIINFAVGVSLKMKVNWVFHFCQLDMHRCYVNMCSTARMLIFLLLFLLMFLIYKMKSKAWSRPVRFFLSQCEYFFFLPLVETTVHYFQCNAYQKNLFKLTEMIFKEIPHIRLTI